MTEHLEGASHWTPSAVVKAEPGHLIEDLTWIFSHAGRMLPKGLLLLLINVASVVAVEPCF